MSRRTLLLLMSITIIADQVTKAAALSSLTQGNPVPVLPGFNLSLGFNYGASFGMLGNVMSDTPLLMAALTGTLTLIIGILAFRAHKALERSGFAFIAGGALGNVIDRLRQGAVTDFIDLYWRDWYWPTFNVADIAITLGALMVLAASLPLTRHAEADREPT